MKICTMENCDNILLCKGLCEVHYARLRRNGKLELSIRKKNCIICGKPQKGNGYCNKHWIRYKKYGDPNFIQSKFKNRKCSIKECGKKHMSKGYCQFHYDKFRIYGDPLFVKTSQKCKVLCCENKYVASGYCGFHYRNFKRHGSPHISKRIWKGNGCKSEDCKNSHYGQGFCSKHYQRYIKYGDDNCRKINYSVNHSFFKELNHINCWVLGWLASDGYIDEKNKTIQLKITDKSILDTINSIMKSDRPLYKRKKEKETHKERWSLIAYSEEMVKDCVSYGIIQKKSLILKYPNIPENLKYDFIRGVFEGDGCATIKKITENNVTFKIYVCSASLDFINGIIKAFPEFDFRFEKSKDKNPVYRINLFSEKAVVFCDKMYENCGDLKLNRKYNKYIEYKNYLISKGKI